MSINNVNQKENYRRHLLAEQLKTGHFNYKTYGVHTQYTPVIKEGLIMTRQKGTMTALRYIINLIE